MVTQFHSKQNRRLASIVGAAILSLSAASAQADAFSTNPLQEINVLKGQLAQIQSNIDALKQEQLEAKRAAEASTQQLSGQPGSHHSPLEATDMSTKIRNLDILAEPPYVILGKVNGETLVVSGSRRILMNDQLLKRFEAMEYEKTIKRMELAGVSVPSKSAGANLLPPPPPNALATPATTSNSAPPVAQAADAPKPGARATRTAAKAPAAKPAAKPAAATSTK